jgi:hypothetical protein
MDSEPHATRWRDVLSGGGPPVTASSVAAVFGERVAAVDVGYTPTHITEIAIARYVNPPWTKAGSARQAPPYFEMPHAWLVDTGCPPDALFSPWIDLPGDASRRGPGTFDAHVPRIALLLRSCEYLLGWNVGNDRKHFEKGLRRAGVSYPTLLWADLGVMFQQLHPEVGKSRKTVCTLIEAVEFYGGKLRQTDADFAFFDALATSEVAIRICDEWLTSEGAELRTIPISGHLGGSWDPRVLDAPIARAYWRLPATRHLDRELVRALREQERGLRHSRYTRAFHEFRRRALQASPRLRNEDLKMQWRSSTTYREFCRVSFPERETQSVPA